MRKGKHGTALQRPGAEFVQEMLRLFLASLDVRGAQLFPFVFQFDAELVIFSFIFTAHEVQFLGELIS